MTSYTSSVTVILLNIIHAVSNDAHQTDYMCYYTLILCSYSLSHIHVLTMHVSYTVKKRPDQRTDFMKQWDCTLNELAVSQDVHV